MAVSTIKGSRIRKRKEIQITYTSTSVPSEYRNVNIAESGLRAVAVVGHQTSGSLGSFVIYSSLRVVNDDTLYYECRMMGATPTSVTQNKLYVDVEYEPI